MATRFWVTSAGSGTGTWDASDTTHWSASSGGLGGASVPGVSDTVTFDALSCPLGETVTVNTNFSVTSVTMGAFTGTLDFSANNNSPTMQTFNCSGTGTRTLNMGSGTWNVTGIGTCWDITTATNLTLNANTSTITITNASSSSKTFQGGAKTYNDLIFSGVGTGNYGISGASTFRDFTLSNSGSASFVFNNSGNSFRNIDFTGFTGTWSNSPTLNISNSLTISTGMTVTQTGTVTFNGTSGTGIITSSGKTLPFSIILNGVGGTWQLGDSLNISDSTKSITLTNGTFNANNFNVTCGLFSSSNSNTRTLTMGSGTWTLTGNAATIWTTSTSTNLTVTANTAIVDCTYSGATGTRTLTSSTGASAALQNLKISAGTDTVITTGTFFCVSLNFTGFTGTWTNTALTLSGNLTFGTGMTATAGSSVLTMSGTGSQTITSNGVTVDRTWTLNGVGGTFTLQDSINTGARSITLTNGTFNANNQNLTLGSFASSNSNTRTIIMGSGTWTLTGTGTVWNTTTITGLTLNANTSTITVNNASASSKTLALGALTYYNLILTGGGTGKMIIGTTTSTKTFHSITVDPPLTVQVFAGATLALSAPFLLISGNGGQINTFQSTTNGVAWNITASSGTFNENYLSLQDSAASGGATFYAGGNSTNVSGNSGWIFTDAPDTEQTAVIDANGAHGLLAASSEDGRTPIRVYADANTHALFITIV